MAPRVPGKPSGPLVFLVLLGAFAIVALTLKPAWHKAYDVAHYTECRTNLELVADRQATRVAQGRDYLACPTWPSTPPTQPTVWADAPSCWGQLGFEPDIFLRGQYRVDVSSNSFSVTCRMDLDGDGDAALFEASDERTVARDPAHED